MTREQAAAVCNEMVCQAEWRTAATRDLLYALALALAAAFDLRTDKAGVPRWMP